MERRNSASVVIIAGVLAALIMAGALFLSHDSLSENQATGKIISVPEAPIQTANNNALEDWREELLKIGITKNTNTASAEEGPYTAPRGLASSEALARELFVTYSELKGEESINASVANAKLSEIASHQIDKFPSATTYTQSSLTIESGYSIRAYEEAINKAFRSANTVTEYELNTFARAMSENSSSELKKLKSVALTYTSIKNILLNTAVPEEVVEEHLDLVNSMSKIALAVEQMSAWGGDSVDALILVGKFSDAESSLQEALNSLFTFTSALKKRV
ncbi:hypothetical protein COU15_02835 [Candidatus Kaiserbacteria bacterium CG10_big_fil_rev_8_21_14_0_10_45_20]|uniref:Uncharacterized protein n=1 Tax=Candidatus Kaiserbacteria bacterium CG10_big_fil_rev_8_21_14_0_10_45_20 TaxID=1974607 RepID=A0A2H0UF87_9BACT|nr:MAG: hypothetical protein COU15_02835 [Candidatus Kaiserbacteria bacterium CG10_big_fil_rev_8_21_14_0_10_45_20]